MSELSIQERLAMAIKQNDMAAIEVLAKEVLATATARHKAELEAIAKDDVALAGKREQLGKAIHALIVGLKLDKSLKDCKAWGFNYKADGLAPEGPDVRFNTVSLLTPQAPKTKGGKGGGGKSKSEFGMSLGDIAEKFGTPEEKAAIANLSGNPAYFAKLDVKKRAIQAGLLKPAK